MRGDDRPTLLDAPPVRGERVVRAATPVPVTVTVRWSDLLVEQLHGEATHWAYPRADAPDGARDGPQRVGPEIRDAGAVVHCRLDGCQYRTQIMTWFPANDVRRRPTLTVAPDAPEAPTRVSG